jgi:hypothetical protein
MGFTLLMPPGTRQKQHSRWVGGFAQWLLWFTVTFSECGHSSILDQFNLAHGWFWFGVELLQNEDREWTPPQISYTLILDREMVVCDHEWKVYPLNDSQPCIAASCVHVSPTTLHKQAPRHNQNKHLHEIPSTRTWSLLLKRSHGYLLQGWKGYRIGWRAWSLQSNRAIK